MNVLPSQFRLFQSENSASNVVRKQDVSNAAVVRKPFADRAVNCHSPNLTTTKKPVCEDNDIAAETLSQCSDLDNDDFCSDIKVEDDDYYEDILPLSKRLEDIHVHKICSKFLADETEETDFIVKYGPYECQHGYPLGKIAADVLWTARKMIKDNRDSEKGKRRGQRGRLPRSYHKIEPSTKRGTKPTDH